MDGFIPNINQIIITLLSRKVDNSSLKYCQLHYKYQVIPIKLERMTTNLPLISIIIPIYNSFIHLDNCINSIRNQSYHNIEIILIDDGSIDNSLNICYKHKELDSRIIVFHQRNKGISEARNKGLEIANGNYIAFCDNDDILHPQMIELLYKAISEKKSEIAMCMVNCNKTNNNIYNFEYIGNIDIEYFSAKRLLRGIFGSSSDPLFQPCNCIWNKLYSKEIINNCRFEDKGYEDTYFANLIYCNLTKDCAFIKHPLYFWIQHSNSKSHYCKFDLRNYLGLYTHLKNYEHIKSKRILSEIQGLCLTRLYKTLLQGKYYSKNTPYQNKVKKTVLYIHKKVKKDFFSCTYISLKSKIIIIIFLHINSLYSLYLKKLNRIKE